MPITYSFDADASLVRTVCEGDVTFDEVLRHFRKLSEDPRRPDHLDVLLDLEQTLSLPDSSQLQTIAVELREMESVIQWGVFAVVAKRDVLFGMVRVFQAFAEDRFQAMTVVRDRAEAEGWLASRRKTSAPG